MLQECVNTLQEHKTIICIKLRFRNLYGKYDKFEPTRAHLIPAVIAKIHQAKEQNLPQVEIWGDGSARREFMYAEDLADFVFYALEKFEKMPQNLNVGLGYDYNINEYYQTIAKIIGYEGEFCTIYKNLAECSKNSLTIRA